MSSMFSWVDLASLLVATTALCVTLAIFLLGRRMVFRQQRERARELTAEAWKVLCPIRTEGLNSKIIVMNVARYQRGYDGSNRTTWRGDVYGGVELLEIAHDGIEVSVRIVESYYDDSSKRTLNKTDFPAPNIIETGHIPWDWIEYITPEGDEYDGSAIFFVRHRAPGRLPYDYGAYREGAPEPFGPDKRDYYPPIKELGRSRPRLVRDWWRFIRHLRRENKMVSQFQHAQKDRA